MKAGKLGRWAGSFLLLVMVVVVAGGGFVYWQLSGSLAQLDGEVRHNSLSVPVLVERDAQGIPRIISQERADSAFALGFLHAQERYFQMDLLRRNSAGELSALFGEVALDHDRTIRRHQFRQRALAAYEALPEDQKTVLDAYVEGVNHGLGELRSKPFEYWLLGQEPLPWLLEDTFLTLYSMYLDLQPNFSEQIVSRGVMRDLLPADWFAFLQPDGGEWDAPLHGDALTFDAWLPEQPLSDFRSSDAADAFRYQDPIQLGSNNWSVGGALTGTGSGMVANDMHLGLNVPNIWYRATWNIPGENRQISGATLPGAPAMVVGSNQRIAWGYTNSNADFQDVVLLQTRDDQQEYLTPDGWEPMQETAEVIEVADGEPFTITVRHTRWGPVIGRNHQDQLMVMRWVAHDVEGANLNNMALELATTVEEALPIAQQAGIPGQNFVVVDDQGQQAWTIMGRLPERFGDFDGREPRDWSDGSVGWAGYLAPESYP
ncbi:MAG: penicillin acylase family protein, partial [Natronospirillum sp.]|uniref:penicillin acylase family protein n=1 Tax=Natronospirillum sp. TaxID=2812955 RepID=UPI0025D0B53E